MPYKNECVIKGHLGGPADLKTTKNDKHFATFSIATSSKFGDEDRTTWHRCVVWGKPAAWTETWEKGDLVEVAGSYESREWTDNNGNKKTFYELPCRPFNGFDNENDRLRNKANRNTAASNADNNADLPF